MDVAAAASSQGGVPEGIDDGALLAAVIDNRAGEVGLAVLAADSGTLLLAQHVETTRTFVHTLSLLAQHAPQRVLVVAQAQDMGVAKATRLYTQVPVPRGAWDDSAGYVALTKYATAEARAALEAGMLQAMTGGYLAYAAAGALLSYLETGDGRLGVVLVGGSLGVRHVGAGERHMAIDAATVAALELIQPIRVGTCSSKLSGLSLFKVLDRTKTKCGARLLRANLLQPLRDIPTLNARYDCVEELMADDDMAFSVTACLGRLPKDLDMMCGSLSLRPVRSEAGTLRRIAAMIQSFILLNEALAVLPALSQALAGAKCELLRAVAAAAGHAAFVELGDELEAVLEEDVASAKNTFLNKTQQCFAVKKGVDGFLDVARATFCRVTEQVHTLADQLRTQHRLPGMQVRYAAKKGFHLVLGAAPAGGGRGGRGGFGGGRQKHQRDLPLEEEEESAEAGGEAASEPHPRDSTASQLAQPAGPDGGGGTAQRAQQGVRVPPGFSVLQRSGRSAQVTTSELNALNSRLRDATNDCMVLTEQVLEGLADRILSTYLPLLHRLVDGIALLDMLAGFAQVASGTGSGGNSAAGGARGVGQASVTAAAEGGGRYVRPVLTESGPIALVEARHPVLERLEEGLAYQPNDTFLALNSSFHVITGPNMSGKSTYLRQVAVCVVCAQVGAFVPATFASLAPRDRLLARLGTGDSLETCSSSFMVEMQEMAFILGTATPCSLVLIDELGRATSTADGVGIAWAVSERLISVGAPTLFATHFAQLTELAALYPFAKALHFDVGDVAGRRALAFSWRLHAGAGPAGHYGLLLAAAVGFPEEVLEAAEEVVQALDEREEQRVQAYATPDAAEMEAVYDAVHKLSCLAQSFVDGGGGERELRALQKQLRRLRTEAQEALGAAGKQALPALCGRT